ncbi:MAG: ribosome biogenesis GTPase Der [Sedimentisphaerales bacterium]|nr:ribosome biogenesis GTPase Der [Sedimentisphaerales bacterium]
MLPVVAIVGRPNVGKSSLFNILAGRRISIVEPTAGVTRDRVSTLLEHEGQFVELVDTGGYGIEDSDNLTEHVEGQIRIALGQAFLVLFMVDIRQGITALDRRVAELLRKLDLPVLLLANKADSPRWDDQAGEFFALGFGEPLCISAQHGRNRLQVMERIFEKLSEQPADPTAGPPGETIMKLAVVGRRNVGKSTFINQLAGEERMIVSEVPGTTRDAVDVHFTKDGHTFIAIDTAGVRKKSRLAQDSIDFYSYTRALQSIRRADVVLFFLDAIAEISQVDKRLARTIAEEYKPCILVVNKWDLARHRAGSDDYLTYINQLLPGLSYAPISFVTAREGKNVLSAVDLARSLHKQAATTVTTGRLNKVLREITGQRVPAARRKVGLPKIYYGTQVAAEPPTLLLFVNDPQAIDENYRRYLLNRLRERLPFGEVPIRLLIRHHRDGPDGPEPKA